MGESRLVEGQLSSENPAGGVGGRVEKKLADMRNQLERPPNS